MKEELLRLAERCKAATGPDRELDGAIHGAIGDAFRQHQIERMGAFGPNYTASLDAAMALVPEGWLWGNLTLGPFGNTALLEQDGIKGIARSADAATLALAICAASLKARASVKEQNNGK